MVTDHWRNVVSDPWFCATTPDQAGPALVRRPPRPNSEGCTDHGRTAFRLSRETRRCIPFQHLPGSAGPPLLGTPSATLFLSLPFCISCSNRDIALLTSTAVTTLTISTSPPLAESVALRILRGRRPRVSSVAPLRLGARVVQKPDCWTADHYLLQDRLVPLSAMQLF
jgi:hypothetical protein